MIARNSFLGILKLILALSRAKLVTTVSDSLIVTIPGSQE